MSKDTSHLIFIVDRSGSMSSIASEMEKAISKVIKDQKSSGNDILVTYVRFDDHYEEVFADKSIQDIDGIRIESRGCTALLDALGRTINNFERRMNNLSDEDKPEKALFVIITDGQENASKEFSRSQVFEIIAKIKRDHKWDFTFIGANQDSISEGSSIGVVRGSSLNFAASAGGVRKMGNSVSNYVTDYFTTGQASYNNQETND